MTIRRPRRYRLLLALALGGCSPSASEETLGAITLAAPEPGASTSDVFVTLRGSVSPPAEGILVGWENAQKGESGAAEVTATFEPVYPLGCAISPFPCDPVGTVLSAVDFSAQVLLVPGPNRIRVTARDEGGRTAHAEVEVTQLPGPAAIRIGRPGGGGDAWTASRCRESLSVSATGAVSLAARNEATGEEWGSGPASYWPLSALLAQGPNRLVASATGIEGDVAEDAVIVTLEYATTLGLVVPRIGIDETWDASYPLQVRVDDCGSPATVIARNLTSGVETSVEGAGVLTLEVALASGRNDVRVTVDLLGARDVRDVTLYRGAAPADWCAGTAWELFQSCPSLALLNGP